MEGVKVRILELVKILLGCPVYFSAMHKTFSAYPVKVQGRCNHHKHKHCGASLKLCSFCYHLFSQVYLCFKSAADITRNLMKGFCIASPVSKWKATAAL